MVSQIIAPMQGDVLARRRPAKLPLDTTVASLAGLAELGFAGTTGPAVAERAGLSRGAQLHHLGTRDQMVVAAVEHLARGSA